MKKLLVTILLILGVVVSVFYLVGGIAAMTSEPPTSALHADGVAFTVIFGVLLVLCLLGLGYQMVRSGRETK